MKKSWFITLILYLSLGSIGATFITPILPMLGQHFNINNEMLQKIITDYLMGYAVGQLVYGPISNKYNATLSIKIGTFIGILGCILSVLAIKLHEYNLMLFARFIAGIGFACGAKVTFSIVMKTCEVNLAASILSMLTIGFALVPSIGVLISSQLANWINYTAPFYFMIFYAIFCFWLSNLFAEIKFNNNYQLSFLSICKDYAKQFKDKSVLVGGVILGSVTLIVYIFASFSSIIAISTFGINESEYGVYNLIPMIGIFIGVMLSSKLHRIMSLRWCLIFGFICTLIGVLLQYLLIHFVKINLVVKLFIPMIPIYVGLSLIFGNISALALSNSVDKSNASAVFNFINLGFTFVLTLFVSRVFTVNLLNLVTINLVILVFSFIFFVYLLKLKGIVSKCNI